MKRTPKQKKMKRLCKKFTEEIQDLFDEMECEEAESEIGDLVTCAQGYTAEVAEKTDWEW